MKGDVNGTSLLGLAPNFLSTDSAIITVETSFLVNTKTSAVVEGKCFIYMGLYCTSSSSPTEVKVASCIRGVEMIFDLRFRHL